MELVEKYGPLAASYLYPLYRTCRYLQPHRLSFHPVRRRIIPVLARRTCGLARSDIEPMPFVAPFCPADLVICLVLFYFMFVTHRRRASSYSPGTVVTTRSAGSAAVGRPAPAPRNESGAESVAATAALAAASAAAAVRWLYVNAGGDLTLFLLHMGFGCSRIELRLFSLAHPQPAD